MTEDRDRLRARILSELAEEMAAMLDADDLSADESEAA